MEDARTASARESDAIRVSGRTRLIHAPLVSWIPALLFLLILAMWEIGARSGALSPLLFPAPTAVSARFVDWTVSGAMWANVSVTLTRWMAGFVLGAVPALILGLAMGWSLRLRQVVDPIVAAIYPIPKIAILPLIMVALGIGESSKLFVIALATFFPMLINAMAGARQISPIHFEVAENYGAHGLSIFTRVLFPGSLPSILAGTRQGLNTALVITIGVELLSANAGLGATIWLAWETLRTKDLYVALVVIITLGVGINFFLERLARRLVPWQVERDAKS